MTDEIKKQIIDLYMYEKESIRNISKKTGCNRKAISKLLSNNNIEIRTQRETSRKFTCNESYFEEVNSPEKAYWIGFLLADGFIESKRKNGSQKFGVTLSSVDCRHLELLNECLESTYEIKEYYGSGFNKRGSFSKLIITSQKMVDDLKSKGVVESKTIVGEWPDSISKYTYDFLRGYFDGNGSIYFSKGQYHISFTGTESILEGINKALGRTNTVSKCKNKNAYALHYGGNKNIYEIVSLLYYPGCMCLERKYNKCLSFIKYVEKQGING